MQPAKSVIDPPDSGLGGLDNLPGISGLEPRKNAFGRLWRALMTARITVASVLVILQAFVYALGNVNNGWSLVVCAVYLCAAIAVRLLARPKPPGSTFDAQWLLTVGVVVVTFTALDFLQPSGISDTPVFALPVLLASILAPSSPALVTAASVTLPLLTDAWWASLHLPGDASARFLQSGLSGSGFFAVALLANQLAKTRRQVARIHDAGQNTHHLRLRTRLAATHGRAEEALKAGAFDYLTKPVDLKQFRSVVASAIQSDQALPSAPTLDIAPTIAKPAGNEPATARRTQATLKPKQSSVPPALEKLVGHSASMQAVKARIAKVAGNMAPVLIQERLVRPLGSSQEDRVDVRVLSASYKELGEEVAAKRFRQDLYYRLNVIVINIPPLRERLEDLPDLCESLPARICKESGLNVPPLTTSVLGQLRAHSFNGNARELESILHRAVTLGDGGELVLDAPVQPLADTRPSTPERDILCCVLQDTRYNRTAAASKLGLSLRQIRYRIARLNIPMPDVDAQETDSDNADVLA
ncbi:MAG: sigma-54-dependent transcriptional regulator [Polaromonas sp.]